MNKNTLYGLNKNGTLKVWSISTDGGKLFIEHGKEGGKYTVKMEVIKGKNLGRANETTPAQQAELEAVSRTNKQKDKGYRENKADLQEIPLLPMLAADYSKQGHRIIYPCYGSAKLDGVRCLAIWTEDGVQLKSRGGTLYNVPHIQQQLNSVMVEGDIWDGELYKHGLFLEEIVSAVKKQNPNTETLQFIVFDIVSENKFEDRVDFITSIGDYDLSHVTNLQYINVNSESDMKFQHKIMVDRGYEGIMLRNDKGVYESGKRSADLQKYKTFLDDEFEIKGVVEDRNGNAVFVVWDDVANAEFSVTYGDFEERKRQLNNPEAYIGKMLTAKFQSRYKDSNLVQFPVGLIIRDYE